MQAAKARRPVEKPADTKEFLARAGAVFGKLADPDEQQDKLASLERTLNQMYERWAWPPDGYTGAWPSPAALAMAEEFQRVLSEYEALYTKLHAEESGHEPEVDSAGPTRD